MKFCIVLCSHNPSPYYLKAQLYSIRRSTSSDILIFDFGSTEESSKDQIRLAKRFSAKYTKINNAPGARQSFLCAMKDERLTEYDYIFLSDQDDVWKKEKFAIASTICKVINPDLLSHDVEVFNSEIRIGSFASHKKKCIVKELQTDMLLSSNPMIGHTFVISKRLLMDFNDTSKRIVFPMHDWEILFYAVNRKYIIHYLDLQLSYYRIHANNIVGIGTDNLSIKFRNFHEFIDNLIRINTHYFNHDLQKFLISSIRRILSACRISFKRTMLELILLIAMILFYKRNRK